LKPFQLEYLPYNGGTFDKTYNTKEVNPPHEFPTPEGTEKALLVATITGCHFFSPSRPTCFGPAFARALAFALFSGSPLSMCAA
jgi:hypothetical protein